MGVWPLPVAVVALMVAVREPSVCSTITECSGDTGSTVHGYVLPETSADLGAEEPVYAAAFAAAFAASYEATYVAVHGAQPAPPAVPLQPPGLPPMPTRPIPGAPAAAGTMPTVEGAPAEAGPIAGSSRRKVGENFSDRDDVGVVGVYQGNWGGNKSIPRLQQHVNNDVAEGCPCHVVCAQEVDPAFVRIMQTVKESGELKWHVVVLEEHEQRHA